MKQNSTSTKRRKWKNNSKIDRLNECQKEHKDLVDDVGFAHMRLYNNWIERIEQNIFTIVWKSSKLQESEENLIIVQTSKSRRIFSTEISLYFLPHPFLTTYEINTSLCFPIHFENLQTKVLRHQNIKTMMMHPTPNTIFVLVLVVGDGKSRYYLKI